MAVVDGGDGGDAYIKIDKSLTYRGDKTRDLYLTLIKKFPVKKILPQKSHTQIKTPYWNFYRVVLAGWMIRYPKPFFVFLGFCIVLIYNAVTR